MKFTTFDIDGPLLITPRLFEDNRGYFVETFKSPVFNAEVGAKITFVQDNQSYSAKAGTVRGLHYQSPPHAQGKLVRVVKGSIIDVAVDVRKTSPTYGQYVKVRLSSENHQQLWIPEGFLHGFATCEDDTLVVYKVTDLYAPDCDASLRFDDPDLAIDWELSGKASLSAKDKAAPFFKDWTSPF